MSNELDSLTCKIMDMAKRLLDKKHFTESANMLLISVTNFYNHNTIDPYINYICQLPQKQEREDAIGAIEEEIIRIKPLCKYEQQRKNVEIFYQLLKTKVNYY